MKNLFSKISAKLKSKNYPLTQKAEKSEKVDINVRRPKFVKTIAGLTLATVISVTPVALTACTPKSDDSNPTTGVETPVDPAQPTDPANPTNPTNPSNPTNPTNPANPSNPSNPTNQHCQILQNVLTDSYYTNLTDSVLHIPTEMTMSNPTMQPHPFGYLKQDGINIESIKNLSIDCYTDVYIKDSAPNILNISTIVEGTYNDKDYYTNYVLQYKLSDSELKDYKMLVGKKYLQGNLFIQELTYKRQPTSCIKSKILITTYNNLTYYLINTNKSTSTILSDATIDLLSFNEEDRTVELSVRYPYINKKDGLIEAGDIRKLSLYSPRDFVQSIGDSIYASPTGNFIVTNPEEFSTAENISYYGPTDKTYTYSITA